MANVRSMGSVSGRSGQVTRKRRPTGDDATDLGKGILLTLAGGLTLAGLLSLSRLVRLDSVLVASQAIYNVISGVSGIARGVVQLLLGLAQMLGFAGLAVVAMIAVLAVASGSLRIGLRLLPQLESFWNLLAHGLNGLTQVVSLPQRSTRSAAKPAVAQPSEPRRGSAPPSMRRAA